MVKHYSPSGMCRGLGWWVVGIRTSFSQTIFNIQKSRFPFWDWKVHTVDQPT